MLRRAVVLFIPAPAAARVDEIRRRWDPLMAARIDPHVTLVHDVVDHGHADELAAAMAGVTEPFEVTLTTTACWGRAGNGVYLGVDDPSGGIAALHEHLSALEAPAWSRTPYRPHVTLVHGRTVDPELAESAWTTLRDLIGGWPVSFRALDVIELDDPTGWRSVGRFSLGRDGTTR